MPRFAANITWLFNEVPFLDRFAASKRAGFNAVEIQFPYSYSSAELLRLQHDARINVILFNFPPGDWEGGDRGIAGIPGREREFKESIKLAIDYARELKCPRLHVMAGIPPFGVPPEDCRGVFIKNIRFAARLLDKEGIRLLIEPINTWDLPGYFLSTQNQAIDIIHDAHASNISIQMDLYHCQMMEGDLSRKIRTNFSHIGHFQIASVPERQEPDSGEVNYPYLFQLIDRLSYRGWIGCEYHPRTTTIEGLDWIKPFLHPGTDIGDDDIYDDNEKYKAK